MSLCFAELRLQMYICIRIQNTQKHHDLSKKSADNRIYPYKIRLDTQVN